MFRARSQPQLVEPDCRDDWFAAVGQGAGISAVARLARGEFRERETMHLSTHNWMRAEPLEVDARSASRSSATNPSRSRASRRSTTSKETRALLKEYGITLLGRRHADARRAQPRRQGRRPARALGAVRQGRADHGRASSTARSSRSCPPRSARSRPTPPRKRSGSGWSTPRSECFTHAKKVGVKIAVEPLNRFETYIFNRAEQALALADAVSPECGVCLDAYPHPHGGVRRRGGDPQGGQAAVRLPHRRQQPLRRRPRHRSTGRRSSAS